MNRVEGATSGGPRWVHKRRWGTRRDTRLERLMWHFILSHFLFQEMLLCWTTLKVSFFPGSFCATDN